MGNAERRGNMAKPSGTDLTRLTERIDFSGFDL